MFLESPPRREHAASVVLSHVLGSAIALLETSGERLLNTGDFKLRQSLTAVSVEVVQADTLILETTFGLPRYRMPPAEAVMAEIVAFCEKALLEKHCPVLLAYSLGKAQELTARLAGSGLPVAVHPPSTR